MMNKKTLKGAFAVIMGLMMLFVAGTHPFAKPMQGSDSETLIRETIIGFYETQINPSKDSGLRYIPGYVCTKCNLTVPAWMID